MITTITSLHLNIMKILHKNIKIRSTTLTNQALSNYKTSQVIVADMRIGCMNKKHCQGNYRAFLKGANCVNHRHYSPANHHTYVN